MLITQIHHKCGNVNFSSKKIKFSQQEKQKDDFEQKSFFINEYCLYLIPPSSSSSRIVQFPDATQKKSHFVSLYFIHKNCFDKELDYSHSVLK